VDPAAGGGPFRTPITPETGPLLHASPQPGCQHECVQCLGTTFRNHAHLAWFEHGDLSAVPHHPPEHPDQHDHLQAPHPAHRARQGVSDRRNSSPTPCSLSANSGDSLARRRRPLLHHGIGVSVPVMEGADKQVANSKGGACRAARCPIAVDRGVRDGPRPCRPDPRRSRRPSPGAAGEAQACRRWKRGRPDGIVGRSGGLGAGDGMAGCGGRTLRPRAGAQSSGGHGGAQ